MLRWRRWFRRTLPEWLALAVGVGAGALLWRDDEPTWALVVGGGCLAAFGLGMLLHWRSGDAALAWRCPRMDRLGLRPGARDAPWEVLHSAEAAVATLEQEAASFRAFFDGAHKDILASARRSLELHRFRKKMEHVLKDAPAGESKDKLDAQCAQAGRELEQVHGLLRELKTRFIASTTAGPSGEDPTSALRALGERTGALGDALDELRQAPQHRVGGRA